MFNSYVTNYQGVETYQSTRRPSTRSRWARHLWTQALETFGNGTRKCCQLPNPPSISHIFTSFPGPASSFPHAEFASRRNQGQSPPPKCPWWPLLEPRSSVTSHLENTMTLYTYIILYIYVYIISYYSASYPPTPANARGSAPGNKTFGCLCTPCSISTAQQQEGHVWHSFSTVSDDMDDTLGSFWATFCRCSVLHCHCVSLSGRAAFAALAALGSSINSSQAPVHHGASAQHSSRKAMFDTVLLRF